MMQLRMKDANMIVTNQIEIDWTATHTLTTEQVRQLICAKVKRATAKIQLLKKQKGTYECL